MTDEQTNPVTVIPPNNPDWSTNPMLRQLSDVFQNIGNQVSESFTLRARVAKLEADVDYLKNTITQLMSENASLKADLRDAKEQVEALTGERDQLRATVDHTKQTLAETQANLTAAEASRDEWKASADKLGNDLIDSQIQSEDWQAKHGKVTADHQSVTDQFSEARAQWFKQEDELQTQIRQLTAERNMFRDKFDRCKSHAAQIMAMDQAKPTVEAPEYH